MKELHGRKELKYDIRMEEQSSLWEGDLKNYRRGLAKGREGC
jgi:hypothetical protein